MGNTERVRERLMKRDERGGERERGRVKDGMRERGRDMEGGQQ